MKILFVMNTLGAGGAERSMVELAKFLHSQKGVTIQFIVFERRKIGLEQEVEDTGIETCYFEKRGGYRKKSRFLINILRKEQPDVIHSVLAESNIVVRLSRLIYRKSKVIQSLVNTPYSEERKKDSKLPWYKFQIAKKLDVLTARISAGIFYHAITKEVLDHYKPLFKIRNNYRIIHRGRYENKYLNEKEPSEKFTLINVGRQEFAKGQLDILKALVFLRQKYGLTEIYLEILGRPGHYTDTLKDYIKENQLETQVSVQGFVNDVQRRLARADVFVFPSYYEGLGGSLLEAFSSKLPCICSDIPVLQEVVGKEDGALFCPPGEYESLAENIYKLYQSPDLREQLGSYSYARFQEAFKMNKINNEMMEMYKEVATKPAL